MDGVEEVNLDRVVRLREGILSTLDQVCTLDPVGGVELFHHFLELLRASHLDHFHGPLFGGALQTLGDAVLALGSPF